MRISRGLGWFLLAGSGFLGACSSTGQHSSEAVSKASAALTNPTTTRVFGFESPTSDWTPTNLSLAQSNQFVEGAHSAQVSVTASGGTLTSIPLSSLGTISGNVTLQVALPAYLANQGWQGQFELTLNSPTAGIWGQSFGPSVIQNAPVGVFRQVQFTLPPNVVSTLSTATYSDLTVGLRVEFNPSSSAPMGPSDYFYFDHLDFGGTGSGDGSSGAGGGGAGGAGSGGGGAAGAGGSNAGGGGSAGSDGSSSALVANPACVDGACCPSGASVTLTSNADTYSNSTANACIVALAGSDTLFSAAAGATIVGGDGDDIIASGQFSPPGTGTQGVRIFGGAGNDTISGWFDGAQIYGGSGDDSISAGPGSVLMAPGSGVDNVSTGDGDDTFILFSACEATPGKRLIANGGKDTLISPLSIDDLRARGVTVEGFENVIIHSDACNSDCSNKPTCSFGTTCVDRDGQAICGGGPSSVNADCSTDADCSQGLICGIGQGPRFGLASGTNVCTYPECDPNVVSQLDCGSTSAKCGICPICASACGSRQCGLDPVCGQSCGPECGEGSTCNAEGQCVTNMGGLPNLAPAQTVGTIPASFGVSDSGSATYSIPITLPPGRGGMTPKLSLNYDSSKHADIAGAGWYLDGVSYISRCNRQASPNGAGHGVRLDQNDRFCLDGQRLIPQVEAQNGVDGQEYRTELDSFVKVVSHSATPNSGLEVPSPDYFQAFTRDGRVYTYGKDDRGSAYGQAVNGIKRVWALQRVEDLAGNYINFQYKIVQGSSLLAPSDTLAVKCDNDPIDCGTYEILPIAINWGGYDGPGGAKINSDRWVSFGYVNPRSDQMTSFIGGARIQRTHLLTEIAVSVTDQLTRRYKLVPRVAPNQVTELAEVDECVIINKQETCKPPTRFTYNETAGLGDPVDTGIVMDTQDGSPERVPTFTAFDWNGDGRDDVLVPISAHVADGSKWGVLEATGDRAAPLAVKAPFDRDYAAWPAGSGDSLPDSYMCINGSSFTDVDGDGRVDILDSCLGSLGSRYFHSTTSGFIPTRINYPNPYNYISKPGMVVDMNGDGWLDILQRSTLNCNGDVIPSNIWIPGMRGGFGDPIVRSAPKCSANGVVAMALDVDADGAPDLLERVIDSQNDKDTWVNSNWVTRFPYLDFPNLGDIPPNMPPFSFIDVNGDTLKDMLILSPFSRFDKRVTMMLWFNTGHGFRRSKVIGPLVNSIEFGSINVLDLDGDGNEDFAVVGYPLDPNAPPNAAQWLAYRSNGDGTFTPYDIGNVPYPGKFNLRSLNFDTDYEIPLGGVADVDGDGAKDFLSIAPNKHLLVNYGLSNQVNLLTSVVDGMGKTTSVSYSDSQNAVYSHDQVCGTVGNAKCVTRLSKPVVREYSEAFSANAVRVVNSIVRLSYQDAQEDAGGQGWLGFRHRTIEHHAGDGTLLSTTQLTFDNGQSFDSLGLYPLAGRLLARSTTYPAASSSIANGGSFTREDFTTYSWSEHTSGAGRPFSWLDSSVTGEITNQKIVSRSVESFTPDQFGNTTLHTTSVLDGLGTEIESSSSTINYPVPTATQLSRWLVSLPDYDTYVSTRGGSSKTRKQKFSFNDRGELIGIERAPGGTPDQHLTTVYDRDYLGNIYRVTATGVTRDGITAHATSIDYDAQKIFPRTITNALQQPSQVVYDSRNGTVVSRTDANGLTETWQYDGFDRLRQHRGADGSGEDVSFASGTFDESGVLPVPSVMRSIMTKLGGGGSTTDWDSFGRTVQTRVAGFEGAAVIVESSYDSAGRLASRARPHLPGNSSQGVVNYTYDEQGELQFVVHPDAGFVHYDYAPVNGLSADVAPFAAASVSMVMQRTDENGHTEIREQDPLGNVLRSVDAAKKITDFSYGPFDLKTATVDSRHNVTSADYDDWGRLTTSSDPDSGTRSVVYDAFDHLEHVVDPDMSVENLYYDVLDRKTKLVNKDGTSEWIYDGAGASANEVGRLVEERISGGPTGADNKIHYSYEPSQAPVNFGRLQSVTYTVGGESFAMSTVYDAFGRAATLTYPAVQGVPFSIENQYDPPSGALNGVKDVGTGKEIWQVTEAYEGYLTRTELTANGTVTTTRDYWPATGMPQHITTTSAGSTLQDLSYTWDLNDRLQSRQDLSNETQAETFLYDERDRLKTVSGADTLTVDYDDLGNITQKSDVGTYHYDEPQPHAVSSVPGAAYHYDARGNMDTRSGSSVPNGEVDLAYTTFDLPYHVTSGGNAIADFVYATNHERIQKTTPAGVRVYLSQMYERFTPAGASSTTPIQHIYRVYGGGREVAQVTRTQSGNSLTGEQINYLHDDHLGSTQIVTDDTGKVVQRQSFSPFGDQHQTLKGPDVLTGFTGQEEDADLGLINMRGRMYDPKLGRFLTPDPTTPAPLSSQGLNRYSYVLNSPLSLVDPSGFAPTPPPTDVPWAHNEAEFQAHEKDKHNHQAKHVPLQAGPVAPPIPGKEVDPATAGGGEPKGQDATNKGGSSDGTDLGKGDGDTGDGKGSGGNGEGPGGGSKASGPSGPPGSRGGMNRTLHDIMLYGGGAVAIVGVAGLAIAGAPAGLFAGGVAWYNSGGAGLLGGIGLFLEQNAADIGDTLSGIGESYGDGAEDWAEDGAYIYRGVSANHPAIDAAREGRVEPGNPGGNVTPELHNAGNASGESGFTSWTHDPSVARFHALKEGPGGVMLRVPQGAPPPGATWSWVWSPDEYGESEVLMLGTREGATVIHP